jgi:hypothetical protein
MLLILSSGLAGGRVGEAAGRDHQGPAARYSRVAGHTARRHRLGAEGGADGHAVDCLGGGLVDDDAARGCPEETIWLPLTTIVPLIEAPESTSWVPPLMTVPTALPPASTTWTPPLSSTVPLTMP